jgi:hypothetical protein
MAAALAEIQKTDETLEILDTFHDFCTKERKKASGKGDDGDDDDEGVSQSRLDTMKEYIGTLLANTVENVKGKSDIKEIIPLLTNGGVPSLTNFENKIVSYYETEKKGEINVKPTRETLTFETILQGWTGSEDNPLWRLYRTNTEETTILEINKGTKSIELYNNAERSIIANFILNYFFGTSQGDMRCTFDAKAGVVSKIFENIDQVKNVIFPQTIADSATTTFGTMRGRNEFIFPTVTPFPFVSNFYTKGLYSMQFRNRGFDQRNPYGFSIDITDGKNGVELPFSSTQTEGPSVNYLIDLTLAAGSGQNMNAISKKKNILSLGKYLEGPSATAFKMNLVKGIQENTNGLFLDIKRGGDHEAAAVTQYIRLSGRYLYFIFVTIDLLCALESRRRGNPTIWHYGERMILYRFPVELDPAQKQAILKDKIKDAIRNFTVLQTIRESVNSQLAALSEDVELGTTALVVNKAPDPKNKYIISSVGLLTRLLQGRMQLFSADVKRVGETINIVSISKASEIAQLNTFLAKAGIKPTDFITSAGKQITLESVSGYSKELLNESITTINATFNLDIPIDVSFTVEGIQKSIQIYTELLDAGNDGTYYFKESQNVAFNYDTMPFDSFYKCLNEFGKATSKAIVENRLGSRVYQNFARKQLQEAKNYVQDILDQVGEENQAELVKAFPLLLNPEDSVYAKDFEDFEELYNTILALYPAGGGQRGGMSLPLQRGGAGDPQQYFDLADLLLDVSSIAAAFLEPAYTELYPIHSLFADMGEVGDIADFTREHYETLQIPFSSASKKTRAQAYLDKRSMYLTLFQNFYMKCVYIFESYIGNKEIPDFFVIKEAKTDAFGREIEREKFFYNSEGSKAEQDGFYKRITTVLFPTIQGLLTSTEETIDDIGATTANFSEMMPYFKEFLGYINPKYHSLTPSIDAFFYKIMTNANLLDSANEVKDEIQRVWETGLLDIKSSNAYVFEEADARGLTTENFITYILSLQLSVNQDKTTQMYTDSILSDFVDFNTQRIIRDIPYSPIPGTTRYATLTLPILMIFTLLENIQNPNKYSFFIKAGYANKYFNTADSWNREVYNYVTQLITLINVKHAIADKLPKTLSGGKRKYPKKTRRVKKQKQTPRRTKHKTTRRRKQ